MCIWILNITSNPLTFPHTSKIKSQYTTSLLSKRFCYMGRFPNMGIKPMKYNTNWCHFNVLRNGVTIGMKLDLWRTEKPGLHKECIFLRDFKIYYIFFWKCIISYGLRSPVFFVRLCWHYFFLNLVLERSVLVFFGNNIWRCHLYIFVRFFIKNLKYFSIFNKILSFFKLI